MKTADIVIDYYSDVLCVWAWIAQPRLEELETQWGEEISIRHRFLDVFGDPFQKIPSRWGAGDGFEKFAEHVKQSATPFDRADIHPDIWRTTRPRSSSQAHLVLRAVALAGSDRLLADTALLIRRAFFCHARDIGDMAVLLELVEEAGVDRGATEKHLADGSAIAALSTDFKRAGEMGVRGSPTWVLNDGRQLLYGNVGYRILHANIEELLNFPMDEASWC